MEIHRAAYRWTVEEMEAAMRRHMELQIPTAVSWGVGLVLLVGAVLSIAIPLSLVDEMSYRTPTFIFVLPALAIGWAAILGSNALAIQKAKREFAKSPGADQMIEWEVSGKEAKYFQRGLFYTASAWKAFVKVAEVEDGFLLYTQPNFFYWLPFRAFEAPEAIDRVRAFAQESGVSFSRRDAPRFRPGQSPS